MLPLSVSPYPSKPILFPTTVEAAALVNAKTGIGIQAQSTTPNVKSAQAENLTLSPSLQAQKSASSHAPLLPSETLTLAHVPAHHPELSSEINVPFLPVPLPSSDWPTVSTAVLSSAPTSKSFVMVLVTLL